MPKISPDYLVQRVKEVDPGFVMGPVPTSHDFSPAEKKLRLDYVKLWKNVPDVFWWQVVWTDEFTVYERPGRKTAIRRKGEQVQATDPRKNPFDYGTYGKLSLCYACNAYVGLVGYWWIHSTKGSGGRKIYWVSPSYEGWTHLQRLHARRQAQRTVRLGVNDESHWLLLLSIAGCHVECRAPVVPVPVVEAHQHAPLL